MIKLYYTLFIFLQRPFERGATPLKLIGDITESHFYSSSEVPAPDQVVYKRLSIRWVFNK